jgi:hypothetical protein
MNHFNQVKIDVEIIKNKIEETKNKFNTMSDNDFMNHSQMIVDEIKSVIKFNFSVENKQKKDIISFIVEMTVLKDLPDLYDNYTSLIKRLSKSDDYTILNKFMSELEHVSRGDKSMAGVELKLGMELKEKFYDKK